MKRTQVVRECVDALHETEASLQATIASARQTLDRVAAAKSELGLTGTLGDACIARLTEAVSALEQADAAMGDGHREAYRIAKMTDLRTTAGPVIPTRMEYDQEEQAASSAA